MQHSGEPNPVRTALKCEAKAVTGFRDVFEAGTHRPTLSEAQ